MKSVQSQTECCGPDSTGSRIIHVRAAAISSQLGVSSRLAQTSIIPLHMTIDMALSIDGHALAACRLHVRYSMPSCPCSAMRILLAEAMIRCAVPNGPAHANLSHASHRPAGEVHATGRAADGHAGMPSVGWGAAVLV